MFENQKKRENMKIKDIFDKSPSKRLFIHRIHSLQRRADARGSADIIYAWFAALRFRSSVSVFVKTVSVMPFRSVIAVMPLPFWGHVHSISANGRVELSTARLAQWAGRRVTRASEWAELQAW